MKKIAIFAILALTMQACSKDDDNDNPTPTPTTGKVTFYMSPTPLSQTWHLLVDGIDKGPLYGSSGVPPCNGAGHITLTLSTGNHTIDAQNFDGLAWGNPHNLNVTSGCNTHQVR